MSKLPAVFSAKLPSFMSADDAKQGHENISGQDLTIPRLKVLQALSPELDEDKAQYVEGAKPGLILNSVTQELMKSVYVVNLYYERNVNVWLKREMGGGLVGSFKSEIEAKQHLDNAGLELTSHDLVDTATHYLLLLNEDGSIKGQAMVDMISSGLTVSSNWNSNIKLHADTPRYGTVWNLTTQKRSNTKGSWHVFDFDFAGYVNDAKLYDEAKRQYQIVSGNASTEAAA